MWYETNALGVKKILLVEDNKEISNNIKDYLELEWFEVFQVFDGEIAYNEMLSNKYNLILLDLMLPKIDGNTLSNRLAYKIKAPIIMITAKDSIEQKLKWFGDGAIDYIVKPFDLRELEVRIKAHLKLWNNKIVFENLEIDLDKREFKKDDKKINLTTKEFLIFEYLFNNKNRVCTRTDIIEYIWWWEDLFTEDSKLDVYISNLRRKLNKNIIETEKWVWYKYWI